MKNINLIKKEEIGKEESILGFYDRFTIWYKDKEYKIKVIMYEYNYETLSVDVDSINLFINESWSHIDEEDYEYNERRQYTIDIYDPSVIDLNYFIFWDKVVEILKELSEFTGIHYPVKLENKYGYVYKNTVTYINC